MTAFRRIGLLNALLGGFILVCVLPLLLFVVLAAYSMFTGQGLILGDPVHSVYYHNSTQVTVVIYDPHAWPATDPEQRRSSLQLAPGETRRSTWRTAPTERARRETRYQPEAFDEAGNLIFCRSLTWDELERDAWNVVIIEGRVDCR